MEPVVFPDIEALAVAYLRRVLGDRDDTATVSTRVPSPRPTRLVKVTRTGGSRRDLVTDLPQLLLECWDTGTVAASGLAETVRALLGVWPWDATDGDVVRYVEEIGGPAFLPDPDTDLPRYQVSVQVNVRGAVLQEA